ncbi:MAG: chemotaxis protein CheW [Planctomycetota bacterium]
MGADAVTVAGQYATFHIDGRLFGVPVTDVREINTTLRLTPVPHAPAGVRGLVNIRGQVYLSLDLRVLMGCAPAAIDVDSCLVLFKQEVGPAFGVLVDRIGDIVELDESQISAGGRSVATHEDGSADGGAADGHRLVRGVGALPEDLLLILDSRRLLTAITDERPEIGA